MGESDRYNVGMGDWIEQTGEIEDEELSGNGDARKVFARVAEIISHFTEAHPEKEVFLTGNTMDKKRTYSNMISFFLDELQVELILWVLTRMNTWKGSKRIKSMRLFW